jgi:thiamine pyrophosphokinase
MIRAILVGAAPDPGISRALRALKPSARDLKIGVDGGVAVWRKIGKAPDFAVGDFDSLKNRKVLDTLMHIRLPEEKNRSDLYYAAQAAIHLGATDLICVGVTGGRADHHLATLLDLSELSSSARMTALDAGAEYAFINHSNNSWRRKLPKGQVLSIFAPQSAQGVTLSGLKYPLRDARLSASSHGLSNEASGGFVTVRLRRGRLIIVLPR